MTFGILALRIWSLCRFWVPALQDLQDLQSLGPLGSTVSLAALFLPIFMDSLGDVWHLGSEIWSLCRFWVPALQDLQSLGPFCSEDLQDLESLQVLGPCSAGSGGSAVSGALGGPQCHLLHSFFLFFMDLYGFLR